MKMMIDDIVDGILDVDDIDDNDKDVDVDFE